MGLLIKQSKSEKMPILGWFCILEQGFDQQEY